MSKRKQILLTWDAYNNGFVVTAKTIKSFYEDYNILIDDIVYLQNSTLQKLNLAEIDAFFKNKELNQILKNFDDEKNKKRITDCSLIREDLGKIPNYRNEHISITNVTDYQSIYDSLVDFLKGEFYNKDNFDLHINVSPGTPQMHVVWLMLNSAGYLPINSTLWSSQLVNRGNKNEKTVLTKIKFKPQTFLSEVLNSKYLKKNLPVINPNETKSDRRKEAERRLLIFSKIPNAPMLILGERGVGKSTYVKTIIKQNQNNDLPFEELACGTFSEELMRSELFGYEKGAFTGANDKKEGILSKFKNGGILFLDEIHDLSKPLQRQLMQVLQTGKYYPIGAKEVKNAKFRLIAASNLKYSELANALLDADFFDRIARFIVEIPALRHCKDDLKLYWGKVWEEVVDFEKAPTNIWNKELSDFLLKEPLLGNFRDLQKIASYIIAYYIDTKNKSESVRRAIQEYKKWQQKADSQIEGGFFKRNKTHTEIIAYFEKELVEWAIKEYGSKENAAKVLKRSKDMLNKYLKLNRIKE